jgi:hypothetical protein
MSFDEKFRMLGGILLGVFINPLFLQALDGGFLGVFLAVSGFAHKTYPYSSDWDTRMFCEIFEKLCVPANRARGRMEDEALLSARGG